MAKARSTIPMAASRTTTLGMMPRNRKRVDAYDGLTKYLQEEYGITLTIYSQKTKPNNRQRQAEKRGVPEGAGLR